MVNVVVMNGLTIKGRYTKVFFATLLPFMVIVAVIFQPPPALILWRGMPLEAQ